jgi:choline transport protein
MLITSTKAPSRDVWATLTNNSGWPSDGVSFCLGFLTPAFAFAGIDSIVHMAEETRHAAVTIPRAMIGSILINGASGLVYSIVILYAINDVDAVLATGLSTGFPIIEVFRQASRGSARVATAMMCAPVILFGMATFCIAASLGRLTWAFARDNGLPFSSWLAVITQWNKAPTRAMLLNYLVVCAMSLINIGSTVAFNALVSLFTLAFYASYMLPIVMFALRRHGVTSGQSGGPLRFGPWRMRPWLGVLANWAAIAFCIFLIIFLPFPPVLPVTAMNMNWAGVVFIAVMGFAVVDWFVRGKGRFVGPIKEVEGDDERQGNGEGEVVGRGEFEAKFG